MCTIGGNINWRSHYREQYEVPQKNFKYRSTYDPAIPLLGIYTKEMKSLSRRVISTSMFTVVLFTISELHKNYMSVFG